MEAVIELLDEGDLTPTGARIAERADVSLRSIGHHFEDREALLAAVAAHQLVGILAGVVRIHRAAGFEERLDAFLDQRSRVLEALTNVSRASTVHEATSAELRRRRQDLLALGRAEVRQVFAAELRSEGELDPELLDAADVAAGWNTWWWLRSGGLDEGSAQRVVRRMLAALLAPPP